MTTTCTTKFTLFPQTENSFSCVVHFPDLENNNAADHASYLSDNPLLNGERILRQIQGCNQSSQPAKAQLEWITKRPVSRFFTRVCVFKQEAELQAIAKTLGEKIHSAWEQYYHDRSQ